MPQSKKSRSKVGDVADHNESENSQDEEDHSNSVKVSDEVLKMYPTEERSIVKLLVNLTGSAIRLATKTGGVSAKYVGRAIIQSPDRLKILQEAGASLKDMREVAGMTLRDMSQAMNLSDQTLLTAVENGTATLSFELILRLAAMYARHDPVPFIMKFTRAYNPELWGILQDWGIGRLPLHFEREREFINIYRSQDTARKLSDEGFKKVLEYTKAAFDMALHFIAKNEKINISKTKQKD